MAFDQSTRNRLARFVGQSRAILVEEFTRQLTGEYGMDPTTGEAAGLETLKHLDDNRRETARLLRETLDHYLAGLPRRDAKARREVLDRIIREQAFTVLNRLCALRMAEARGLLIEESVGRGYQSKGFALYQRVAGSALGETGDTYRQYLFSIFDEMAVDLPVLFDRYSPQGRLFPRESTLLQLLDEINHADIEPLWAEDETIGWIYQYFNSKEERQQMRKESAAPRNSRELAVRNQFFTPRYVVEFLTDNTLGRIWYEMTRGQTSLTESCRYLVRRPTEIFLEPTDQFDFPDLRPWVSQAQSGDLSALADDPTEWELATIALTINGYEVAEQVGGYGDLLEWARERIQAFERTGVLPSSSLDLWLLFFAMQREWRVITGSGPAGQDFLSLWRRIYREWKAAMQSSETDLSQEELLRQPVYIFHRPLKDPRDIKMLDPACGSMHFGLYAFDLYERIYEEAWEIESGQGTRALARPDGLQPLTELYADKAAFLRDVPRLILAHNIHGIDIDPRAVQIAGLSLWLRAQRSWRDRGVSATERPAITRSNIVCAEPMPGEQEMLDEFAATLRPAVVGDLVKVVFEKMKLAGEAGSLLKIEEELRTAIETARARYNAEVLQRQKDTGYLPGLTPEREATLLDLMELPDAERFWDEAEERVLAALADYAAQIEGEENYRRRLFAQDAARGFAFIELCRQRYDVVLMNPPFGVLPTGLESVMRSLWGSHANDIYVLILLISMSRLSQKGRIGAITSRNFLIGRDQRGFRPLLLGKGQGTLRLLVDLGLAVLDEAEVETCTYIIEEGSIDKALFWDVRTVERSSLDSLATILNGMSPFVRRLGLFLRIVQSPILYGASAETLSLYQSSKNLEPDFGRVTKGLSSSNDERFLRLFWEVRKDTITKRWKYCAKGADYLWFVSNINTLVDWHLEGDYLVQYAATVSDNLAQAKRSSNYYFRPGATYTYRNSDFSLRTLPSDCIFTNAAPVIIPHDPGQLPALFAVFFSEKYDRLLREISKKGKYDTGRLKYLPPPSLPKKPLLPVWKTLTKQLLELESTHEITPYFVSPPERSLKFSVESYEKLVTELVHCVGLEPSANFLSASERLLAQRYEYVTLWEELWLHYCMGCCLGRWDIRYTTGEKPSPELPDPFAPLPVCPPGMLQNDKGLPAAPEDVPGDYPLRISWSGILVDDEGHSEDIMGRVREALAVIWPGGGKTTADSIEAEACSILKVDSLRDYFAKPDRFFADHLSRYSKSRRVAPIYWPLSTTSGSYTIWLYYHRLTDQTLYSAVNDFLDPKLKRVGESVSQLRVRINRSRDEEKELERLIDLEVELKAFRDELLRVATFWRPNLNDGVQITAAPLWRLFRHRQWQKRLKETWEKLEAGDYDWAHLAYSIWPERVRAKCVSDKSLAIAHDLEHLYVEPPATMKKKSRAKKEIEELEEGYEAE